MSRKRRPTLCALWLLQFFAHTPAVATESELCDAAALAASHQTGVPLSILRAVAWAETGHTVSETQQFSSWPWAVQSKNHGNWFDDQKAAIFYVKSLLAEGTRNVDIGCFQLNYQWHGENFASLEQMIKPENNALYAVIPPESKGLRK